MAMKGANKTGMIVFIGFLSEWTFLECRLESTANVVPKGEIFAKDLEHSVYDS